VRAAVCNRSGGRVVAARASTAATASRLTLVSLGITACSLVSAPILARALGPDGRGDLAAVLVPLGLVPLLVELGLGTYAARAAARGREIAVLTGTLGTLLLGLSMIGPLLAFPVAELLAEGRGSVETWLVVGFFLLPVGLLVNLLAGIAMGLERWRTVIAVRLIPPVVGLLALVPLYLTDTLTVATAAASAIFASILTLVPVLPLLLTQGRLRWQTAEARKAIPFGLKAWASGIALSANVRLDQLLMIKLVEPRVLGLYAVAVTFASFPSVLVRGLNGALFPRIAAGDRAVTARAMRLTLLLVSLASIVMATVCEPFLRLLLGDAFADATPMALVLLIACVFRAAGTVLDNSVTAHGAPGASAISQGLALAITVPGLFIAVPALGGVGAALVSVAAYGMTFAYLFVVARKRFGGSIRDYLLVTGSDMVLLRRVSRSAWARATRRLWPRPSAA
jgi:O-antigen/teichoic acid export membrane protein